MATPQLPHAPGAPSANPRGEAMVAELRWVHDMIRRDLRAVRELAAAVAAGLPAAEVTAGLRELAASGPLWQLRVSCLHYCRFVHHHHLAESALLFPALRQANPELGPVVDKLEADHARVSVLLDDVTAAAGDLAGAEPAGDLTGSDAAAADAAADAGADADAGAGAHADAGAGAHADAGAGADAGSGAAARERLIAALRVLSDVLLAHLAYEEEHVADTMRGMTGWPGW